MPKTRLFLDTEFTGLHQQTTLISLGIIAQNGKTFYAELSDYDPEQVNDWINEHVISQLELSGKPPGYAQIEADQHWKVKGDSVQVKTQLIRFLENYESVEIWSDVLAYDWVLFCELFGGSMNLPQHVYYIPFDLATLFRIKGVDPDVKREDYVKELLLTHTELSKHHALYDAMLIQLCYQKLTTT